MTTKLCGCCQLIQPITNFYPHKSQSDGLQTRCKDCARKNSQKHYHTIDVNKRRQWSRGTMLKKQYGLTLEDYNSLLSGQEGVCAICGRTETQRSNSRGTIDHLRVDHCHTTGRVRGLLCSQCNFGLGNFRDKLGLLISATSYLLKDKQRNTLK
jgi:hypothetical protein